MANVNCEENEPGIIIIIECESTPGCARYGALNDGGSDGDRRTFALNLCIDFVFDARAHTLARTYARVPGLIYLFMYFFFSFFFVFFSLICCVSSLCSNCFEWRNVGEDEVGIRRMEKRGVRARIFGKFY